MNPIRSLINIAILIAVVCGLVSVVNADPAYCASCVAAKKVITFEPVTIVGKATKTDKVDKVPTTKRQKTEKPIVVTMALLYVGVEPGQTIPTAKTDVDLSTRREATAEGHVRMRIVAAIDE
jgi:hypothetical protein